MFSRVEEMSHASINRCPRLGCRVHVRFRSIHCRARPLVEVPVAVSAAGVDEGQRLFDHETFGGNGRTCRTCHSGNDGTIGVDEVGERLLEDPSDPLFLHDGLDDFFSGTTRIAAHATILIERELPEGVVLEDRSLGDLGGLRSRRPEYREHAGSRPSADVRHPKP